MVRGYTARVLRKIKDARAVEPLINILKDEKYDVRQKTAEALENITGEGFGISQSQWKEWWEENKDRFVK